MMILQLFVEFQQDFSAGLCTHSGKVLAKHGIMYVVLQCGPYTNAHSSVLGIKAS